MTDKWHWLRHKWTRWESYIQEYRHLMSDIRQQRRCVVCGFVQDELVACNADKMPTAKPSEPQTLQLSSFDEMWDKLQARTLESGK